METIEIIKEYYNQCFENSIYFRFRYDCDLARSYLTELGSFEMVEIGSTYRIELITRVKEKLLNLLKINLDEHNKNIFNDFINAFPKDILLGKNLSSEKEISLTDSTETICTIIDKNCFQYEEKWNINDDILISKKNIIAKIFWRNHNIYKNYDAELKNGRLHGYGRMSYINGSEYHGGWINGKKCGYGEYTLDNGCCYKGQFENNMYHGYGILTTKDNKEISGIWKNNTLIKPLNKYKVKLHLKF